jgi:hypothetical protein
MAKGSERMNEDDGLKGLLDKAKTLSDLFWENNIEWNEWLRMDVTEAKQVALAPKYQGKWILEKDFLEFLADKVVVDRKQLSDLVKGSTEVYDELDASDAQNYILIMAGQLANNLNKLLEGSVADKVKRKPSAETRKLMEEYYRENATEDLALAKEFEGSEPPLNLALAFTDVKKKKGSKKEAKP